MKATGFRVGALAVVLASMGCATVVPLPKKAILLNRDGVAALAAGNLELAEARLAVAVEYSPRFTEAWVNLGFVEMRRGNLEAARKDFERARNLNEDLPAPHHALGLLADKRGDVAEAEKNYRAALKVDPGFAPARANLGRLLFARGRADEAREQFLRLTEVAPDTLDGWVGLVESLERLGREADSDTALVQARARFGDRPQLVILVARQMLRRRMFEEAEETLAPLTDDPDRSRGGAAWAWIAIARLGRSDRKGAVAAASAAIWIDANDPVASYALRVAKDGAP